MGLFGRKKDNDKDYEEWLNKCFSLFKLERYEEAIACFNEAIRLDSEYSNAWYGKGISLEDPPTTSA